MELSRDQLVKGLIYYRRLGSLGCIFMYSGEYLKHTGCVSGRDYWNKKHYNKFTKVSIGFQKLGNIYHAREHQKKHLTDCMEANAFVHEQSLMKETMLKRTTTEWLNLIANPTDRQEALGYFRKFGKTDRNHDDFKSAINYAFVWSGTLEGGDYWNQIHDLGDKALILSEKLSEPEEKSIPESKQIHHSKMVKGEVYYQIASGHKYITRHNPNKDVYISVKKERFTNSIGNPGYNDSYQIRKATQTEIAWLEACEQAGKFVPCTNKTITHKKYIPDGSIKKGNALKISKLLPRVRRGERPSGTIVRGRASKTSIVSRPLSYGASIITF